MSGIHIPNGEWVGIATDSEVFSDLKATGLSIHEPSNAANISTPSADPSLDI